MNPYLDINEKKPYKDDKEEDMRKRKDFTIWTSTFNEEPVERVTLPGLVYVKYEVGNLVESEGYLGRKFDKNDIDDIHVQIWTSKEKIEAHQESGEYASRAVLTFSDKKTPNEIEPLYNDKTVTFRTEALSEREPDHVLITSESAVPEISERSRNYFYDGNWYGVNTTTLCVGSRETQKKYEYDKKKYDKMEIPASKTRPGQIRFQKWVNKKRAKTKEVSRETSYYGLIVKINRPQREGVPITIEFFFHLNDSKIELAETILKNPIEYFRVDVTFNQTAIPVNTGVCNNLVNGGENGGIIPIVGVPTIVPEPVVMPAVTPTITVSMIPVQPLIPVQMEEEPQPVVDIQPENPAVQPQDDFVILSEEEIARLSPIERLKYKAELRKHQK